MDGLLVDGFILGFLITCVSFFDVVDLPLGVAARMEGEIEEDFILLLARVKACEDSCRFS